MSKREQYGLEFNKSTTNGRTIYGCVRKNGIVGQYNDLQFLNYLDKVDTPVHADVPSVCSKTNYNSKLKQCNPTKTKLGGVIFL